MYCALLVSKDKGFQAAAKKYITNINRDIIVSCIDDMSMFREIMMDVHQVDVVLYDHDPDNGLDGIEAFNEMNRMGDMRPYLLISKHPDGDMAIKAFDLNIDFYIYRIGYVNLYMELANKIVICCERRRVIIEHDFNQRGTEALMRIMSLYDRNFNDVLNYALMEAVSLTKSRIGYVAMYDTASCKVEVLSWHFVGSEQPSMMHSFSLDSFGLLGEPIRTGRTIVINDSKDMRYSELTIPGVNYALGRVLMIPIRHNGAIVATAGAMNKYDDYDKIDEIQFTLLMDGLMNMYFDRMSRDHSNKVISKFTDVLRVSPVGVLILDPAMVIVDANNIAKDMVHGKGQDIIGHSISNIPSRLAHLISSDISKLTKKKYEGSFEHVVDYNYYRKAYVLNISITYSMEGLMDGYIVVITDASQFGQEIYELNKRSENAHEFSNSVSSDVYRSVSKIKDMLRFNTEWSRAKEAMVLLDGVQETLDFFDICNDIGIKMFRWVNLNELMGKVRSSDPMIQNHFKYIVDKDVSIFADRNIEYAFEGLCRYSIERSGNSLCMITQNVHGNDLVLEYKDNLNGIGYSDKKAFVQGDMKLFGRNIYLAMKLFVASGFNVSEVGNPDGGLYLRITIPESKIR